MGVMAQKPFTPTDKSYPIEEMVVHDPVIAEENGEYYMFSTGKEKVTGPYLDKDRNRMDRGARSIVVQGNDEWAGIGHNAVYTFQGKDIFVSHAYSLKDGQSYLFLKDMNWDSNGWPVVVDTTIK